MYDSRNLREILDTNKAELKTFIIGKKHFTEEDIDDVFEDLYEDISDELREHLGVFLDK